MLVAMMLLPALIHGPMNPACFMLEAVCHECGSGNAHNSAASENCTCSHSELVGLTRSLQLKQSLPKAQRSATFPVAAKKVEVSLTGLQASDIPPELLASWPFLRRMALAPRAPSSAS